MSFVSRIYELLLTYLAIYGKPSNIWSVNVYLIIFGKKSIITYLYTKGIFFTRCCSIKVCTSIRFGSCPYLLPTKFWQRKYLERASAPRLHALLVSIKGTVKSKAKDSQVSGLLIITEPRQVAAGFEHGEVHQLHTKSEWNISKPLKFFTE